MVLPRPGFFDSASNPALPPSESAVSQCLSPPARTFGQALPAQAVSLRACCTPGRGLRCALSQCPTPSGLWSEPGHNGWPGSPWRVVTSDLAQGRAIAAPGCISSCLAE